MEAPKSCYFIFQMPQQSDSAVSIESEQNDEARRKIEELERKLSESNAKCLETQKQLEGFLGEAHVT